MGTRHAVVGSDYEGPDAATAGLAGVGLVIAGLLVGLIVGLWAED
jgi:hypothetical protein